MQGLDAALPPGNVLALVPAPSRLLMVMIPAYDEAETIQRVVTEILALRPNFDALNLELKVLVIDDGSRDATAALAHGAGADRVVKHSRNLGLGAAVRSGLEVAAEEKADLFVKIDADLQHSATDILAIIAPIIDN